MSSELKIIAEEFGISDLEKRLASTKSNDIFVDVRSKMEFDAGHIPGFVNIPLENLKKEKSLFQDKNVIFCCLTGARCTEAADWLSGENIAKNVIEFAGGFQSWQEVGLAIEGTASKSLKEKNMNQTDTPTTEAPEKADKKVEKKAESEKDQANQSVRSISGLAKETLNDLEDSFVSLSTQRQIYLVLGILSITTVAFPGIGQLTGLILIGLLLYPAVTGKFVLSKWLEGMKKEQKKQFILVLSTIFLLLLLYFVVATLFSGNANAAILLGAYTV